MSLNGKRKSLITVGRLINLFVSVSHQIFKQTHITCIVTFFMSMR